MNVTNVQETTLFVITFLVLSYLIKFLINKNLKKVNWFYDHHKDPIRFIKMIRNEKRFLIIMIYLVILAAYFISLFKVVEFILDGIKGN